MTSNDFSMQGSPIRHQLTEAINTEEGLTGSSLIRTRGTPIRSCVKNKTYEHCAGSGKVHLQTHIDKLKCKDCGFETMKRLTLENHRKKYHGPRHVCVVCNYKTKTGLLLRNHMIRKHPDCREKFLCSYCNTQCKSLVELRSHRKTHRIALDPKSCDLCGESLNNAKALEDHKKSVHSHKKLKCDYDGCDVTFSGQGRKKGHVERVHLKLKKLKCTYEDCVEMFCRKKDVDLHVICHHLKLKDFHCKWPGCGKSFRRDHHLKVHMRIHTGEKPVRCTLCDFTCRQKASLNWHMRKHATGRDASCKSLMVPADASTESTKNTSVCLSPEQTSTEKTTAAATKHNHLQKLSSSLLQNGELSIVQNDRQTIAQNEGLTMMVQGDQSKNLVQDEGLQTT